MSYEYIVNKYKYHKYSTINNLPMTTYNQHIYTNTRIIKGECLYFTLCTGVIRFGFWHSCGAVPLLRVNIIIYVQRVYGYVSRWGCRCMHTYIMRIYIQSLSWYWAMFSLDRERYNLQNQYVYIYAPCIGTDYMP